MSIYIGYDPKEQVAYDVCNYSIKNKSEIQTKKLYSKNITEYARNLGEPQSTDFTFTRFWVPYLSNFEGYSIYVDCDFLFLDDPQKLIDIAKQDPSKAVWCSQHPEYIPKNDTKMDNIVQNAYHRKNWSSLMVFNNEHPDCFMKPMFLNTVAPGIQLHQFRWTQNIGGLSLDWNCLDGYYMLDNPKAIHYTDGGPWFKGFENTPYSDKWTKEYIKLNCDLAILNS